LRERLGEHLWRRLDSMDFINRGMLCAAVFGFSHL